MIIKKYKYKNRVIGYVESYFSDQDGQTLYAIYQGNNKPSDHWIETTDSQSEALKVADNYFTRYIAEQKVQDKHMKLLDKLDKKYQILLARYTENHTRPLSNFDRDLIDRIIKDYAFRLGLNSL